MKRAATATSESGGVIDLTNDTDDDNNETKDSNSKKPDRDKDNDEPKSKKLKKETEQFSRPSGSKLPNKHVSSSSQSSKQQDKRTFHSNYHGNSSSRERQWIQMGWNPHPQRNNRTMPPFGRGSMHVQQPRRPLPQHQHSPTPPLMAMDFPSTDVFSHPSDQFRVGPCPDPDTFRPLIGTAVTIFREGTCFASGAFIFSISFAKFH